MIKKHELIILAVLALMTVVAYESVRHCEFLTYDDDYYVTACDQIEQGLNWETIVWTFTEPHYYMWHPLTTLSYLFEYELFGLDSFWYHVTNLLLHIVNSLLLFWVLKRMTGSLWASAFVACVFALHPLQVESVAWVAERKNLLSGFFWILTIATYARYCRRPGVGRYAMVVLIFCFALMSKPSIVTLPFVLLLLDYWPLKRFGIGPEIKPDNSAKSAIKCPKTSIWRLIVKKIPLLCLSAVISAITYNFQQGGEAVLLNLPLRLRIANAIVSYVSYIGKLIYPTHLAVLYPHRGSNAFPLWQPISCLLILVGVTIVVIYMMRRRRYLAVGWLWYLGTLVPVAGFIQAGTQSMADRYMYLPSLGILIMVAWSVTELTAKLPYRRVLLAIGMCVLIAGMLICTRRQVTFWENDLKLFGNAVEVTENNYEMHNNLGVALHKVGRLEESIVHFDKTLSIKPDYVKALYNKGKATYALERYEEAVTIFKSVLKMTNAWLEYSLERDEEIFANFESVLKMSNTWWYPYNDLGLAYDKLGKYELAVENYNKALQLDGNNISCIYNLALTLMRQGKLGEALDRYKEVLELRPDWPEAHYNLGVIYARQQKFDPAVAQCIEALRLRPDYIRAHVSLAGMLYSMERVTEAIGHYDKILEIDPNHVGALNDLGYILAIAEDRKLRDAERAIELAQKACELTSYEQFTLLDTLAVAYAAAGRFDEAVETAEKTLELAKKSKQDGAIKQIEDRLDLFRAGKAYIEPASPLGLHPVR